MNALIQASNVLCAIGRGSAQVWAAARAGLAGIQDSALDDQYYEPIPMGLVPQSALMDLPREIMTLPLPGRARRMLQLAAATLRGLSLPTDQPLPLFLGLPPPLSPQDTRLGNFPHYLQIITGHAIDLQASVIVPEGRAAALLALQQALEHLRAEPDRPVLVGGVDSYLDRELLDTLEEQRRLRSPYVMDGFTPGEGAAFLLLSSVPVQAQTGVVIKAAASVQDPGHRHGSEPARGEGLAHAIDQLRNSLAGDVGQVATVFAGLNGESFESKLWGVAQIRHRDFLSPAALLEHPADKFGDAGAALGAILMAMAATALSSGGRTGPALVWAASDHEPRACALLSIQST